MPLARGRFGQVANDFRIEHRAGRLIRIRERQQSRRASHAIEQIGHGQTPTLVVGDHLPLGLKHPTVDLVHRVGRLRREHAIARRHERLKDLSDRGVRSVGQVEMVGGQAERLRQPLVERRRIGIGTEGLRTQRG